MNLSFIEFVLNKTLCKKSMGPGPERDLELDNYLHHICFRFCFYDNIAGVASFIG